MVLKSGSSAFKLLRIRANQGGALRHLLGPCKGIMRVGVMMMLVVAVMKVEGETVNNDLARLGR